MKTRSKRGRREQPMFSRCNWWVHVLQGAGRKRLGHAAFKLGCLVAKGHMRVHLHLRRSFVSFHEMENISRKHLRFYKTARDWVNAYVNVQLVACCTRNRGNDPQTFPIAGECRSVSASWRSEDRHSKQSHLSSLSLFLSLFFLSLSRIEKKGERDNWEFIQMLRHRTINLDKSDSIQIRGNTRYADAVEIKTRWNDERRRETCTWFRSLVFSFSRLQSIFRDLRILQA